MRIITGVLGLTHVPQRMNNVPQRPEEKGRVPVPLVARWSRQRPELIGSGVKDGELVLGVVRAPALQSQGPVGRGEAALKAKDREPPTASLHIEEVIERSVHRRRRVQRLPAPRVRLKVVLTDRALDHPVSRGAGVFEASELPGGRNGSWIEHFGGSDPDRFQIRLHPFGHLKRAPRHFAVGPEFVRR
ncbi:MAG: hypothetical protein A3I03_14995 [Candidatus Rokubacteria bacterium RIFCSPLOWO2_02_FULL_68_19]|nr:MAG: hypothetical protein A3I03_14995 [Candidatus Rokubacteria bacterium RIFCSPLOWO2_02_FULL_68_19]